MPRAACLAVLLLLLAAFPAPIPPVRAETLDLGEPVVMRAAAVAEAPDGSFVGSTASITITAAANGSGHVFLDTFPLTEIDMQGSARLAARVAAQVTGKRLSEHDFFFVMRSGSQVIGGPSAGATLTVGAIAALNGWEVRPDALMTGTIQPDGSIGPVGGIPEKAQAAARAGVERFLFPSGEELVAFHSDPLRPINLTRYCTDELGMECIPVADVLEATGLMTDHAFERPPLVGNVTGEEYRRLLSDVSRDLVANADARMAEAREQLARLPSGDARTALGARLDAAQQTLDRAREATAEGSHYTASSLSFQAAIDARHVRDSARAIQSPDPRAVAADALEAAAAEVERVRKEVDALREPTTTTFEAVGAAQVRVLEAEARLAQARRFLAAGQASLLDALSESAWAHERASTVGFWLRIVEALPDGDPISADGLRDVARDTLTTSGEEIAYVRAVFETRGVQADLTQASASLAAAEAAFDQGYHPAATALALEASVRAGVLLEILGYPSGIPEGKFEQKRQQAALAIQAARDRGFEPFLAQSQYEFALSLEAPADQLTFLGLSRVSANMAGLPGLFADPRAAESRFTGPVPSLGVAPAWIAAAFALGLALGVGCGLVALMPRSDEDEKEALADARAMEEGGLVSQAPERMEPAPRW